MSSEPADDTESFPARGVRRRRPLRVPISSVPRVSALEADEPSRDGDNGASFVSNVVELDPMMGTGVAIDIVDDADPTEPSFVTEPDPLGEEELEVEPADASEPSIDVHFSDPPRDPPETKPPALVRHSEPPEELFLEDAEVLSRSDIAPPMDGASDMVIPIPKPPPPPAEPSDTVAPEVENDEDGEPWHESFFGEAYLRTVRVSTPREVRVECDFIERAMQISGGSRVLDVGCGLGSQTVELAARGYHLVGLDISPTMVSRAADEAEDRGLHIDFVRGDMREMPFEEPFDAVLCWGTTFGYFDESDNERAIRQFHRVLKPNGVLLLDVVNRDFMIGSQPNQVWFEVDGAVCMEETDFDYQKSRLRVKRRVASHSGQQTDRYYSIRLYALHEMCALLERNGFRVDAISGREATLGVFFGVHSPKMIIRAERLPGPFSEDVHTPPPMPPPSVPRGALRPSELPPDGDGDE